MILRITSASSRLMGITCALIVSPAALQDILAGQAEECGPSSSAGWYDAETGLLASSAAAGAFHLIDDHEYAVLSHTDTHVTLLNPWNPTNNGGG